MKRRSFLQGLMSTPFLVRAAWGLEEQSRHWIPWSAVGDVTTDRAQLAAGGFGPGTLVVDWSTSPTLSNTVRVKGGRALRRTDWTSQVTLTGLPPSRVIHYRASVGRRSITGRFRTPPASRTHPVTLLWGGDVVGQGWGIDPARGGMLSFKSMLDEDPDLFIHCGDTIYADDPIEPEVRLDDGSVWKNIVIPEKLRPARSLSDFHGCFRYNLLDAHYRRFFSNVPVLAQWDDHEVKNNWDPVHHAGLADDAWQAFRHYWPIGPTPSGRIYRKVSYGPNLDVFLLDLRSYRAPNGANREPRPDESTRLLGRRQIDWFKRELAESRARWKIVGGEMPIATFAPKFGNDSWANGEGPPLGREHELAEILTHIRDNDISNVVWLSADVHYAMAIEYLPQFAHFKDFKPFWEFIAGPLHAGTFAPTGDLDSTFGARERFCAVPRDLKPNRPPSEGLQFYGKAVIREESLEVTLHNQRGDELYRKRFEG